MQVKEGDLVRFTTKPTAFDPVCFQGYTEVPGDNWARSDNPPMIKISEIDICEVVSAEASHYAFWVQDRTSGLIFLTHHSWVTKLSVIEQLLLETGDGS